MDQTPHPLELPASALRQTTDPAALGFKTTQGLEEPAALIGQERARAAMELALGIPDGRYNLFVMGAPGAGRTEAALALTRAAAAKRSAGSDWVYVHNFETPEEPLALELAAGRGRTFAHDVEAYVTASRRELRRAFSSEAYSQRRDETLNALAAQRDALLDQLRQDALAHGFALQGTPAGLAMLPLKPAAGPGSQREPYSQQEFQALPEDEKQRIASENAVVEAAAGAIAPKARDIEEEMRAQVRMLDSSVADNATRRLYEAIAATYAEFSGAAAYLAALRMDILAHAAVLRVHAAETGAPAGGEGDVDDSGEPPPPGARRDELSLDDDLREVPPVRALLRRYSVNVMVARRTDELAPVVIETNPTYANLMGRIDMGVRDGLPYTDHMMLRPGAMHRAVGGFLVLQARDVLTANRAWEAVKRMARFGDIELENGSTTMGATPGATIRPQPVRADIKVTMIGDPATYAALAELDPEFRHVFKVRADLDTEMARDTASEQAYARVAGAAARKMGFPALTSAAVAQLIEEGSRWAEDQTKLSTELVDVGDLSVEAGYFARAAGAKLTDAAHLKMAIEARERRSSLLLDRTNEAILDNVLMVATTGSVIGQINGLSVRDFFGFAFGEPNRITARVSPGLAGVVTVERETAMSGPTHTKGVLVLSGYLAGKFAQRFPLSLAASLCFEQLYSGVDGDSASSAELYALLSALADAPIHQGLAVTGSVNQRGEVQAIGGVTHKVEGFFHICQSRGLTGEQGVLIPAVNARNLMLRHDVVEAVRAGLFHIYGINTVEEGIQLLTGIPFGTLTSDGKYLAGTIAERTLSRLAEFSERVRMYGGYGPGQANHDRR